MKDAIGLYSRPNGLVLWNTLIVGFRFKLWPRLLCCLLGQDSKSPSLITEEYMGTNNFLGNPVRNFESRGGGKHYDGMISQGGRWEQCSKSFHALEVRSGDSSDISPYDLTLVDKNLWITKLFADFRGYKKDDDFVVLCIHGFPTSNYDWSKVSLIYI